MFKLDLYIFENGFSTEERVRIYSLSGMFMDFCLKFAIC